MVEKEGIKPLNFSSIKDSEGLDSGLKRDNKWLYLGPKKDGERLDFNLKKDNE